MRVTTRRIADRLGSDSHYRAIHAFDTALIEAGELDEYLLLLPDSSQGTHYTQLNIDRWGHLQAWCDCAHVEYRRELCAHILTLLLARQQGVETVDGHPITPRNRHDAEPVDDDPEIDSGPITADESDAIDTGDGITVDGGIRLDDGWEDRL